MQVRVDLGDDGTLSFLDETGQALPPSVAREAFRQHGERIRRLLEEHADRMNRDGLRLADIHFATASPPYQFVYSKAPFDEPMPERPEDVAFDEPKPEPRAVRKPFVLFRFIEAKRRAYEEALATAAEEHRAALARWEERQAVFERGQAERRREYEVSVQRWNERRLAHEERQARIAANYPHILASDAEILDAVLEREIGRVEWPRETVVSFDHVGCGETVLMDVDLPEIEDMPDTVVSVSKSGRRLVTKKKSPSALRKEYARHVHGCLLLLAGTVFSTVRHTRRVTLSGYSQRLNAAVGRVEDQYLLSVAIDREAFLGINFANLAEVDPVEALAAFDLRRSMTATGIFKPIEPFGA